MSQPQAQPQATSPPLPSTAPASSSLPQSQPKAPPAAASGHLRVGNYVLLSTLGIGSFGKVKLAYHLHTHAKVALKFIQKRKLTSVDMHARVKREVQYLRSLRHPHIIKLYEVIHTPTDIIMVMEYADGELFDYIVRKGRMSEPDARRFFQQLLSGVSHCHAHSIVHRDLKPENLLLSRSLNYLKLADFGLSNMTTDGEFLRTSCGSPNYAAPEVISGKLYAGPEVDVWSCGVILYVMTCGRLPFDDEYIPNLFHKINGGIFTIPSFLSPDLKVLISRMLTVNPVERITIEDIYGMPWFDVSVPQYLAPHSSPPPSYDEPPFASSTKKDRRFKLSHPVVQKLAHCYKLTPETVRRRLKTSSPAPITTTTTTTCGVGDHHYEVTDLQVGYQLLLDAEVGFPGSPGRSASVEAGSGIGVERGVNVAMPVSQSLPNPLPEVDGMRMRVRRCSGSGPLGLYKENRMDVRPDGFSYAESSDSETNLGPRSTVAVIPASLPQGSSCSTPRSGRHASMSHHPFSPLSALARKSRSSNSSAGTTPSRPRWHVGIRSRSPPLEVMLEIFKSLSRIAGLSWKVLDRFLIRCRCGRVKLELQLYQMDTQYYLVDFKHVPPCSVARTASAGSGSGGSRYTQYRRKRDREKDRERDYDVLPFFDLCCRIIDELRMTS